jgi:hypothetical protein
VPVLEGLKPHTIISGSVRSTSVGQLRESKMSDKSQIGYFIELEDFESLKWIEKMLYGSGSILNADDRRDMANLLNTILNDKVIPLNDDDLK